MEKERHIVTIAIDWQGIALSVSYEAEWLGKGACIAHLQVLTPDRRPLPITETGYRSHFVPLGEVEAAGGPVAYVFAWLDEEASNDEWRSHVETTRQGSLF
jgi:hypothetical protein